jgi:hypothetical protein
MPWNGAATNQKTAAKAALVHTYPVFRVSSAGWYCMCLGSTTYVEYCTGLYGTVFHMRSSLFHRIA